MMMRGHAIRLAGTQRLLRIADALPAFEELRSINQSPFMIDAAIDEIRVIERKLDGAVDDGIGGFNAQHE